MEVARNYLNEVCEVSKRPQSEQITRITQLLNLNPQINPVIVKLNSVQSLIDTNQIDIDNFNIYNNEWPAFEELLLSFIRLSNQLNPWSALQSLDLYTTYLNDLSVAFNNNNRGYLLSYLIRDSIDIILPLSIKLDFQLYFKEFRSRPRLTFLASVLFKIFNNIRSQINDTNQLKKTIILYVSNKLCLIYFKIDNPLLCRNIFSNMNNANLNFKSFPKREQIQYRYYLARFYLIKDQLTDSFSHLQWCLLNCPVQMTRNLQMILKYLLPVSLVIGKIPNFNYISQVAGQSSMIQMYASLADALKNGNLGGFDAVISQNYTYLKDQDLLLLLVHKSRLILLRNLVRKVWYISGQPSNLDYDIIGASLKVSLGNQLNTSMLPMIQNPNQIDDYLIENIFITLIDQNLLKGKLFPRLRKVALSKTNAFAKIDDIYFTRFRGNSRADSWMD